MSIIFIAGNDSSRYREKGTVSLCCFITFTKMNNIYLIYLQFLNEYFVEGSYKGNYGSSRYREKGTYCVSLDTPKLTECNWQL